MSAFRHFWVTSLLLACAGAQARPVQIIHTNDLHSHMDYSGSHPSRGGYGALKRVMDRLRAEAQAQGIPTLVLDAGDFSEGTPYFLADDGLSSWRALDELGYDAVALGNHDYQIGTAGIDDLLSRMQKRFALVAANYKVKRKDYPHAHAGVQPYAELTRSGLRIAVLGLTTNELFYRWTAAPGGKVDDPVKTAKKLAKELARRNDFVIALTHTGLEVDRKLAAQVPEIGMVVGGHSHTFLAEPEWVSGTPIVQAGEHGQFVGDLLVDIEPGREPVVLRYGLVEVDPRSSGEDARMAEFVAETREALERRYGRGWLDEQIAWSDIPMERPVHGTTDWGAVFARTFRERAHADVGMDIGEFYGPSQPGGPVTREKLMRFYPRVFDHREPKGWTIWTVKIHGKALIEMIRGVAAGDLWFNLDGLTYRKTRDRKGRLKLVDFRIGGKSVNPVKQYTVAVSEGLGRGSQKGHWLARAYFRPRDTGIPIWFALEEQLRALRVAVRGASVRE